VNEKMKKYNKKSQNFSKTSKSLVNFQESFEKAILFKVF
jgi:hypothetical protein